MNLFKLASNVQSIVTFKASIHIADIRDKIIECVPSNSDKLQYAVSELRLPVAESGLRKNLFKFSENEMNLCIKCSFAVYRGVKCQQLFSGSEDQNRK